MGLVVLEAGGALAGVVGAAVGAVVGAAVGALVVDVVVAPVGAAFAGVVPAAAGEDDDALARDVVEGAAAFVRGGTGRREAWDRLAAAARSASLRVP